MKKHLALFYYLLFLGIGLPQFSNAQYKDLLNFNITNGSNPYGSLVVEGNKLYGMAMEGGAKDSGCIFSLDTNGGGYKDLVDLDGAKGYYPYGSLTLSADGKVLYGMSSAGGTNDNGVIFAVDTDGGGYRVLLDFSITTGANPQGDLTLSGNKLYGMTKWGGTNSWGNVFSIDTNGGGYKDILNFNITNGMYPYGSVTFAAGKLYGMTNNGGANNSGVIFSVDTNGSDYKDLLDLDITIGETPYYTKMSNAGNKLYGMLEYGGSIGYGVIFSMDTNGSGYKIMENFNGADGSYPYGSLTLSGNTLYGMTYSGGTNGDGRIFSIDTNGGSFSDLYDFDVFAGNAILPYGSLALEGKMLFGMSWDGGAIGSGSVFRFKDTSIITSVNQLSMNSGRLIVYPNPNNGKFNVFCHSVQSEESRSILEVYNELGERVLTATLQPQTPKGALSEINLSNQPNGIYLFRVLSKNGNLIGKGKIIIQK